MKGIEKLSGKTYLLGSTSNVTIQQGNHVFQASFAVKTIIKLFSRLIQIAQSGTPRLCLITKTQ